jgi:hypothetical protein
VQATSKGVIQRRDFGEKGARHEVSPAASMCQVTAAKR